MISRFQAFAFHKRVNVRRYATRLFEKYQDDLFKYMHLLSVGKLIVILLYMGHIFGCFFHYFSAEDWRTPEVGRCTLCILLTHLLLV
jgi:hypothetical protein